MTQKIKPWKVTKSEYLFQKPWLTIRQDFVELPNGSQIPNFYVLEYPNWVNTIAITKDGQFLFVEQYRHGLQHVAYELCAGVCDEEDASPMESARRELLEETGYGGGNWQEYMKISANPSTHTNLAYCFLATGVEKLEEPHLEATEDLAVHFLSLEQVKQLLDENKIEQSVMAAPLWKYMAEYGFE